ncbi:MAG: RNA-binding protein [Peptococcaceae bacterium]|nr:MAG: RNA-binding protein [Peptococcaceae bacterium]
MCGESAGVQMGSLACSLQGRDKGRFYLVVGIDRCGMVLMVDGEKRKVNNPKRKNLKHLKVYREVATMLVEKIQAGKRIADVDVRKAIKSLL